MKSPPAVPEVGTGTALIAPPEFGLVSFDKFEYPQLLPSGLGDLPLYPDRDGFFSVNGSLDLPVFSSHESLTPADNDNYSTLHPLITDIPGFSGESPQRTPDCHSRDLNDQAITMLVTSTSFQPFYYAFLFNDSPLAYKHILREGVTSATSLVALGDPHSPRSRH